VAEACQITRDFRSLTFLTIRELPDLTDTHHRLQVHASRMRGVRIVEHDDNKGCKTTFQFMTPSEKSTQEVGTGLVGYLALAVIDHTKFSTTSARSCWKDIRMLRT